MPRRRKTAQTTQEQDSQEQKTTFRVTLEGHMHDVRQIKRLYPDSTIEAKSHRGEWWVINV